MRITRVDKIVKQADVNAYAEYATLEGAKLAPIGAAVMRESEEGRWHGFIVQRGTSGTAQRLGR